MTLATFDVRELLGHPGMSQRRVLGGSLSGLGNELARVPDDEPVAGELRLESVVEGILVSGTVACTVQLRCARCLKEFEQPLAVPVSELFVMQPAPDSEDYPLDPEGELDPEQMVRDAVGVELPFSPLCMPDCKGLCEVCGGDRNLGECPGHAETDPRWAALDQLLQPTDQN